MSRSSVPAISVAVPPSRRGLDDPCTKMLHNARPPSSHSDRTQTSGVPNELADACQVRPCRQYPSLSHRRGGGSTTHAQKCSTTQDRLQATRIAHKRQASRMSSQMHVSFVRAGNIRRCPTVAEGARRPMHKNAPQRKTASKPLGSHTNVRCPE